MHHAPSPWQDLQIISLAPSYRGRLHTTKGLTVSSFCISHWSFWLSHPSISERKYVRNLVGFLVNQGSSILFFCRHIFEVLDFYKLAVSEISAEDSTLIPILCQNGYGIMMFSSDQSFYIFINVTR